MVEMALSRERRKRRSFGQVSKSWSARMTGESRSSQSVSRGESIDWRGTPSQSVSQVKVSRGQVNFSSQQF